MGEESDEGENEQRRIDQQPMVEQNAIYGRPLETERGYMKQTSMRSPQGKWIYDWLNNEMNKMMIHLFNE